MEIMVGGNLWAQERGSWTEGEKGILPLHGYAGKE